MTTTETKPTTANLFPLADRLRALRDQKKTIETTLKDINKEISATEQELSDVMAAAECQSFTRDGKMFILTNTSYWSAEEGCLEALYTALRENGYGHLFTVHSQTLGSFLREAVNATADEDGEPHIPDWLTGLIKNYDKTGVTMRTSAKKTK